MNLYLVKRTEEWVGYDNFEALIAQAATPEEARRIHPRYADGVFWHELKQDWDVTDGGDRLKIGGWTKDISSLEVQLIGKAVEDLEEIVVLADYQAG